MSDTMKERAAAHMTDRGIIALEDMVAFAQWEIERVHHDIAMIPRNKPDGVFAYEVADEIEDGTTAPVADPCGDVAQLRRELATLMTYLADDMPTRNIPGIFLSRDAIGARVFKTEAS